MKVAKIIDKYRLAISTPDYKPLHGEILLIGQEKVHDPDTGAFLGSLEVLRAKVSEVHPKFVVAETYRLISPIEVGNPAVVINIGDEVRPFE